MIVNVIYTIRASRSVWSNSFIVAFLFTFGRTIGFWRALERCGPCGPVQDRMNQSFQFTIHFLDDAIFYISFFCYLKSSVSLTSVLFLRLSAFFVLKTPFFVTHGWTLSPPKHHFLVHWTTWQSSCLALPDHLVRKNKTAALYCQKHLPHFFFHSLTLSIRNFSPSDHLEAVLLIALYPIAKHSHSGRIDISGISPYTITTIAQV